MTESVLHAVAGVRLAAVEAGIKKKNRKDLVLLELAEGTVTAGVFTTNRFCAAPVQVAKAHLAAATPRFLMINTGYANAGTGQRGLEFCQRTCDVLAGLAGCRSEEVLPFSTGVIGEFYDVARFEAGLPGAVQALSEAGWASAAEGIMTTDTHPKTASREIRIDGKPVHVTGMTKGSGMIHPNMATMLGFVATDAAVAKPLLESWLRELTDRSFNSITVDGDTSTNDSCLLMATGKAGNTVLSDKESTAAQALFAALDQVFKELAHAMVRDGEGATKFVSVQVDAAASREDARAVAFTIAHSPLVKTALFASDPNWGRILAAVGRAPIAELDVNKVRVWLGDVQIVAAGGVAQGYTEAQGAAVMRNPDILIRVDLGLGDCSDTVWTCDFSYDYVKINAEYRS